MGAVAAFRGALSPLSPGESLQLWAANLSGELAPAPPLPGGRDLAADSPQCPHQPPPLPTPALASTLSPEPVWPGRRRDLVDISRALLLLFPHWCRDRVVLVVPEVRALGVHHGWV